MHFYAGVCEQINYKVKTKQKVSTQRNDYIRSLYIKEGLIQHINLDASNHL